MSAYTKYRLPHDLDFEILSSLIDRADTAASAAGGRKGIPHWICTNTSDPKHPHKDWSFKGHEYQIQILADQAPHIGVEKAAQLGISEIVARAVLALLAKLSGESAIYVLPSSKFASKFATSRVDPIIKASDRLKAITSREVNSTELKQIGTSFLYIGGAQKESQAISIPARILVRDEYSFGNPDILSVYQSRLGHNEPKDRIILDFSTPLYPEMGISELYERGTKFIYMCYHERCGQWVDLDPLRDIVLPGFDDELVFLDRRDLKDPRLEVKNAWTKCPHCSTEITRENLAEPSHRSWVAHHPEREIHTYRISPLDAASFKSAPQIVADLDLYRTTTRWIQYGIGQPFESADSQIVESSLDQCFTTRLLPPGVANSYGAVAGMDVGKVSHLVNGKAMAGALGASASSGIPVLEIFNMETIKQGGDNELGDAFIDRYKGYRCLKGIIDAEPDVSVVKYVQKRTAWQHVWGCYFVRSAHKASLELYEPKEEEGVVNARRTMVIDEFVKDFNSGLVRLPKEMPFEQEVRSHLKRPKRIVNEDALGTDTAIWVSKGEDHWFFALLYAWLAADMLGSRAAGMPAGTASNLVSKVKMQA